MNDEKKPRNDKRSQRTKLLLAEALQTLLEKDGFSGITVNDICIEAEVSRATFYLYFEDKYKLLQFSIGLWSDEIRGMADTGDLRSLIDAILAVLQTRWKVINNLLVADRNEEVQGMMHASFAKAMVRALEKQKASGAAVDVPVEALAVFVAGGLTYTLIWWLEGSFKATREEMCDLLVKIAEGKAITGPEELPAPSV